MTSEEETYRRSIDEKLERILEQTTKTNGRVTALEQQAINERIFRARVTTAISLIAFIVGSVLIPLVAARISGGSAIHTSQQSVARPTATIATTYGARS